MPRILINDDDLCLTRSMVLYFESFGYEVIETDSNIKSYMAYKTQKPDMLITDYYLPRSTGLDLIKKIRENDKKLPILLISGDVEIQERFVMTSTDYNFSVIAKPFELNDIKTVVESKLFSKENKQEKLDRLDKKIKQLIVSYKQYLSSHNQDIAFFILYSMYRSYLIYLLYKSEQTISDYTIEQSLDIDSHRIKLKVMDLLEEPENYFYYYNTLHQRIGDFWNALDANLPISSAELREPFLVFQETFY